MIETALAQSIVNDRQEVARYQDRMDSVLDAKLRLLEPLIEGLQSKHQPVVISFGSGSGKVERQLALKGFNTVAIDLSLPMLDAIKGQAEDVENRREALPDAQPPIGHLWVINADATQLPFKAADGIVALSVVHEIASFGHNYDFAKLRSWFADVASRLEPDGYLAIKDFAAPANPHELVTVRLGVGQAADEMSPLSFVEQFGQEFKGAATDLLNAQIVLHQAGRTWKPGAALFLPRYLASELIAHYSWHSSPEEIHERYAYLTPEEYAQFVIEAAQSTGVTLNLVASEASTQAGYDDHTKGRIDLLGADGQREMAPVVSASWVWQRATN